MSIFRNLTRKSLLDCHAYTEMLTVGAQCFDWPSEKKNAFLRSSLTSIRDSVKCSENRYLSELTSEIEALIDRAIVEKSFSQETKSSLIQRCDEMRFCVLSLALWAMLKEQDSGKHLSDEEFRSLINELLSNKSAIHFGLGGIIYSIFSRYLLLSFPTASTYDDCHNIIEELSRIYDLSTTSNNWIVDFSGVQNLPHLFLGHLLSYQIQLRQNDGNMHLCWVSHKVARNTDDKFIRLFDLVEIGGHWFSRTAIESGCFK